MITIYKEGFVLENDCTENNTPTLHGLYIFVFLDLQHINNKIFKCGK